jgi:hypothetical protein
LLVCELKLDVLFLAKIIMLLIFNDIFILNIPFNQNKLVKCPKTIPFFS